VGMRLPLWCLGPVQVLATCGGWWKVPSALSEDGAPSASQDHLKARRSPAPPRAPPE